MKRLLQLIVFLLMVSSAFSQAPIATSFTPSDDATGISPSTTLTIKFDVPVRINTANPSSIQYLYVYDELNDFVARIRLTTTGVLSYIGCSINISKSVSSSNVEITLDEGVLLENSLYYVTVSDQLFEAASNNVDYPGFSDVNYWNFTTGSNPVPPTINDYSPAQGAINVGIAQPLILTFNDNIALGGSGLLRIKKYSDDSSFDLFDNTSPAISISGDKLTIYPHSDFVENTKYYVTIDAGFIKSATSGADFAGISNKDQWSFTSESVFVWKGSASSDWTNVSNWVDGKVFVNNSTLKIPDGVFQPIVTTNIITNDLIIGDVGGITIDPIGNITINGKLELQSSPNNNADFACLGGLVYDPNKVSIYQHIDYEARTYHVASPVIGATQTSIGCDLGMYQWNTSSGVYELYSPSAVMGAAQGFALRSNNNLLFSGSIQTGDVIKSISRTGSNAGWNFVGNPYPCAIDMKKVVRSSDVLESFWIYNSLATTYGTINALSGLTANTLTGVLIPSNHAFWTQVKPTFTTGDLTFSNACKATAPGSYLKVASIEPVYYSLKLACGNGAVNDEFLISFAAESTDGYDKYDSEKKFSTNLAIAQPFMPVEGKSLIINSYPKLENELIVPVTLRIGTVGDYTFERISIENFEESVGMFLIDLQENQTIDLRNIQSYPFSVTSTGDLSGRFVVKFVGTIATLEQRVENVIKPEIGVADNKISITFADDSSADVKVFTLDGKCINESKVFSGVGVVDVESKGIYILKIVSTNGVFTQKILIQ